MRIKKWLSIMCMLVLCFCMFGCTSEKGANSSESVDVEKEKATVYGLVGPTGVGLANLMAKAEADRAALEYQFQLVNAPEVIVSKITTGEADLAAVSTNLAATLYQKTNGNIQIVAINTGCVLSIVEDGTSISSISDLKGKTIYSTGEGSNPEYILRHILEENGLDPDKDVTLKFVQENEELSTFIMNGTAKIALIPEPLCTTVLQKKESLHVALNIGDEWGKIHKNLVPHMGCVIATKDFIAKHKEALGVFLHEYKVSIEGATQDLDKTAQNCEKFGILPSKEMAKKAIPNCQLEYISDNTMESVLSDYFKILYGYNPKSVGGSVPDSGLYYGGTDEK